MFKNLGMCVLMACQFGIAEIPPWYVLAEQPDATFAEVKAAYDAGKSAEEPSQALAKIIAVNPEYYEQEEGFRFDRWAAWVEPRISSHDEKLGVVYRSQTERLKLLETPSEENGDWVNLGPFAENTNGSGRIDWMDFHPVDDKTMMVGTSSGGAWITYDKGENWSVLHDRLTAAQGAGSGVFHPINPDIMYLGTGDPHGSYTFSSGVFKSEDGGKNWERTSLVHDPEDKKKILKLAMTPDGQRLLVGASDGLFISDDGGENFNRIISEQIWDLEISPANPDVIYASGKSAFFISRNGGDSFQSKSGISGGGNRVLIEVSPSEPRYVAVLTSTSNAINNLYISNDEGGSFTKTGNMSEPSHGLVNYAFAFGVSTINTNQMAVGAFRHYKSTNNGGSFVEMQGAHLDVHDLVYDKTGNLYALNDGGIYLSTGGDFVNVNNNLSISQGYRIGVDPNDYDQICTGRQDNGTDATWGGGGFRNVGLSDGMECFYSNDGKWLYNSMQKGGWRRCPRNEDGSIEQCTFLIDYNIHPKGSWNAPFDKHPNESGVIMGFRVGDFYKSTNNGDTWKVEGKVGTDVTNFDISLTNPQVMFAVGGQNIYRTANGGKTWSSVWSGASNKGKPHNLVIHPEDSDKVWVTFSSYNQNNKVLYTSNGGGSWQDISATGLPALPVLSIDVDGYNENGPGIYVGTDAGVYYRDNRFENWQNFSSGIPYSPIFELEIATKNGDVTDRKIIASTFGRGVWSSPLWDDALVKVEDKRSPAMALREFKYHLNGSSSQLTLEFQMGRDKFISGQVTLMISDVSGRVLETEKIPAFGRVSKSFDWGGRTPGVYFVSVIGPGHSHVKTLSLLK